MAKNRIIIVGQNPSAHNTSPLTPFIGSKSGRTLFEWLRIMEINPDDVTFVNASSKLGDVTQEDVDDVRLAHTFKTHPTAPIIALGAFSRRAVDRCLKTMGPPRRAVFTLPHPSGRNRQLNDPNYVESRLLACKSFLSALLFN